MMAEKEMNELPPCLIFIDKEGRWYHKGAEMIGFPGSICD